MLFYNKIYEGRQCIKLTFLGHESNLENCMQNVVIEMSDLESFYKGVLIVCTVRKYLEPTQNFPCEKCDSSIFIA